MRPGDYSRLNFGSHRVVNVFITEWGLRGWPLTAEVSVGRARISILGESFVFAEALNAPRRITEILRELAGPAYEIVNKSVPGYGTGQQFRMVEDLISKGFQLGSKVILVFFTNDTQDNMGLRYPMLEADLTKPILQVDETGNLLTRYCSTCGLALFRFYDELFGRRGGAVRRIRSGPKTVVGRYQATS